MVERLDNMMVGSLGAGIWDMGCGNGKSKIQMEPYAYYKFTNSVPDGTLDCNS